MAYTEDGRLPVIYVRGFAGSAIDKAVDDPFYGFNKGSVHVRVGGTGDPRFHQFEGPMLRLMLDEGYQLLVEGDQRAFLEQIPDGEAPARTVWVHRFYDVSASTLNQPAASFSLEDAAADLFELIKEVRRATGAPRVFLVAHSMGGLICRSVIQRVIPNTYADAEPEARNQAASQYIARVFTYATPHGGIEFDVGWGLLERLRDLTGIHGADIFGPARMYEYLTPDGPEAPDPDAFDPRTIPADIFPLDNVFCLVGTNPEDYAAALGLSSWAVGPRSDGLVQLDNAYVRGAHVSMVHRSHSGRYGIVNSEEGYQNLRRFLFGDLQVEVELVDVELPSSDPDLVWQLETGLSIRGLPVLMHEQSTAHCSPLQLGHRREQAGADGTVPLLTAFLSSRLPRPRTAAGRPVSRLRHALKLRLISVRERRGSFFFTDHLEQTEDWQDVLVVDVRPANKPDASPRAWAVWNSALATAIRDWTPRSRHELSRVDNDSGRWRARIPLPRVAHRLLGADAALRLTVTPRSVAPAPADVATRR